MGDCYNCSWYDIEKKVCHNPDSCYMEYSEPDWGCTLWEKDPIIEE